MKLPNILGYLSALIAVALCFIATLWPKIGFPLEALVLYLGARYGHPTTQPERN